tara:strand:+ start:3671 stop:5350 length:1680 start_codon:yes stop_codon:yes gene_type:complete
MLKQKLKVFSIISFFFTLIFTFSIGEIFYNSIDGTDFYRYFRYIEYFDGTIETPSREQGLFYFWFIFLFIDLYDQFFVADKWEYIYSSAIQLGNFALYLVGILGLFLFMKIKKINTTQIFLALTFLNIFPPVFGGRLIMKPEMLAFALFPWILLGIELYFKNKNIVNLLAISPLLAVIATSKGTVFVLTVSGIFYIYFKKILKAKYLDLGIAFLIFLIMSYLLYQENLKVNNVSMLSHPELESYLFRAPLSFIYTLNLNDLFSNPFRNVHAGSLFGITAIDLFGDYFNRYWDHERSLFISNRKQVITFLDYPRRNISVILSIIFFIFTFIKQKSFKFKSFTKVYLVGMFILLLTSLGLFGLHFNPNKGDTVKTHYYFFLLAFSFVFLIVNFLRRSNVRTQVIVMLLAFLSFTFIVGFPKSYDDNLNFEVSEKIPTTLSCRYVSGYFESITNFDIECLTKDIATCGIYEDFNKPIEHEDGYLIFQPDDFFQNINLQDSDGNSVTVSGYAECLHYLNGGYAKAEIVSAENRTPKVNRIFLFLIIISFIYLVFNNKSYLINR